MFTTFPGPHASQRPRHAPRNSNLGHRPQAVCPGFGCMAASHMMHPVRSAVEIFPVVHCLHFSAVISLDHALLMRPAGHLAQGEVQSDTSASVAFPGGHSEVHFVFVASGMVPPVHFSLQTPPVPMAPGGQGWHTVPTSLVLPSPHASHVLCMALSGCVRAGQSAHASVPTKIFCHGLQRVHVSPPAVLVCPFVQFAHLDLAAKVTQLLFLSPT